MRPSGFSVGVVSIGLIMFALSLIADLAIQGLVIFNLLTTLGIAHDVYRVQTVIVHKKNGEFVEQTE